MAYYKGIVQRVHVGDPQPPKQEGWSESAKFGLQIDDKWHNSFVNKDKKTGAFTVKDKNYNEVTAGCEVEFMTTEKNGFENIDKKTLTILASGSNVQPPVAQQPTQQEKAPVNASDDFTEDDLKDKVAEGQASANALMKGKCPTKHQLGIMTAHYRKML